MVIGKSSHIGLCKDFTGIFPLTLSEDIFTLLDVSSLCSASQVSRRWYNIINNSDYIWHAAYLKIKGTSSVLSNLSYKAMVAQQYTILQSKAKWLSGKFSFITSFNDLQDIESTCIFSKDDWGDILQQELQRC